MKRRRTILELMAARDVFGPLFRGETWDAWRVFLAALFGLGARLSESDLALYRRCTGRADVPTARAREAWLIVGRRGGKSRIAALLAVFLACFGDYSAVLAAGERGTLMVLAADRRQARTVFRFIAGLIDAVPTLAALVDTRTADAIHLSNRVSIEVHTASYRAVRGYTIIGVICDELAFWPVEDAADPDTEVLNALRPAMATVPGALLIAISSPYAKRGELYKAHQAHYGHEGDPILVWQSATTVMNPSVPQDVIERAYAEDEAVARAEYGAEFRGDVERFLSRDLIEAVVAPGRLDLPALADVRYHCFIDPAGGSGADSFTMAIAHKEANARIVVDVVREWKPPFSPEEVVRELAAAVAPYRIGQVVSDRFAGEWPREACRRHNLTVKTADLCKSDLYKAFLPTVTARTVELPDSPRLVAQLAGLDRRTARGGHDSIDHAPRAHDDVANAVAGVVRECGRMRQVQWYFI